MNKILLTNLIAVLITFIGLFPSYDEIIFFTGLCFVRPITTG